MGQHLLSSLSLPLHLPAPVIVPNSICQRFIPSSRFTASCCLDRGRRHITSDYKYRHFSQLIARQSFSNTANHRFKSNMPSFAIAKHELRANSVDSDRPVSDFAFAFDIDGVLLKSSDPLPGASEALNLLHDNKIPFILLTNGGGKHESARVAELSKKLGVPLAEENFVQSHTPFKLLLEDSEHMQSLRDKTVLVLGGVGDKCREVAQQYGFQTVVTSADILQAYPHIWPFNQMWTDFYKKTARPLPRPMNLDNIAESLRFDAVLVFNSPRDYALDLQLILDLMMSKNGILGTTSEKNGDPALPNDGWQQDGQPPIFFSNPDLVWATDYHQSRIGQGAFQAAIAGVWHELTGGAHFYRTVCGKPHHLTYSYGENVLTKYRQELLGSSSEPLPQLKRVFMVGDNPESDIRGANDFQSPQGTDWTSILIETGVFQSGGQPPKYAPKVIVKDVFAAVKWALKQQGWE